MSLIAHLKIKFIINQNVLNIVHVTLVMIMRFWAFAYCVCPSTCRIFWFSIEGARMPLRVMLSSYLSKEGELCLFWVVSCFVLFSAGERTNAFKVYSFFYRGRKCNHLSPKFTDSLFIHFKTNEQRTERMLICTENNQNQCRPVCSCLLLFIINDALTKICFCVHDSLGLQWMASTVLWINQGLTDWMRFFQASASFAHLCSILTLQLLQHTVLSYPWRLLEGFSWCRKKQLTVHVRLDSISCTMHWKSIKMFHIS